MAPKTKFTKEQIIDAAFDIASSEGFAGITIRSVAAKLGSSVAPIYVNFKDTEELLEAVIEKTLMISKQILQEQQSGDPFKDIGMASLLFAKKYSVLFLELINSKHPLLKQQHSSGGFLIEHMRSDPIFSRLSDEQLELILLKMKLFHTGISVMAASNQLPDAFEDEAQLAALLNSTAIDLIVAAHVQNEKTIEQLIQQYGGPL